MNSSTAIFSSVKTNNTFRDKVHALLAELVHVLDLTGRAYLHGVTPL